MGIKISNFENKQKEIPEEFKDLAKDFAEKGFITTSTDNLINWARTGSLHWMTFGLACCAVFHLAHCAASVSSMEYNSFGFRFVILLCGTRSLHSLA